MENQKFNTGDIVKLKSGGPNMTVGGYNHLTGNVICRWFNDKKSSFETIQCDEMALTLVKLDDEPIVSMGSIVV